MRWCRKLGWKGLSCVSREEWPYFLTKHRGLSMMEREKRRLFTMPEKLTMDKLTALCKVRGYIFAGSEIYGGLANTWDYGPLGVEFKNNIKKAWWKKFVQESRTNVGLDSSILMNRQVWVASGHVGNFNDPLMDCKACKARFRADQLIEDYAMKQGEPVRADGWSNENWKATSMSAPFPAPSAASTILRASASST